MDAGTEQGATPEGQAAEQAVEAPLSLDDEIVELKKLLADDPEDFQAQCRLGEVYFAKGMLDEALENVSKAIDMAESIRKQMDHSLAMYYANRGTIQATKGDMDEAMSQFRKALEINPKDVLALFNLGRALYDRDEYMEAMPLLERLVDVTPDDPIAWFQLAKVYEKLDLRHVSDLHTIDSAIMAFRRVLEAAVESNPEEPLAYYNLISTYEKAKRFAEADQTRERLKQRFASRRAAPESKDK